METAINTTLFNVFPNRDFITNVVDSTFCKSFSTANHSLAVKDSVIEVTGDGVLLWPHYVAEYPCDEPSCREDRISSKKDHHVLINICPPTKNGGLHLATEGVKRKVEEKSVVCLISDSASTNNVLFDDKETVTVIDLFVNAQLYKELKTKETVYSFCNELVEYFIDSSISFPAVKSEQLIYSVICNLTTHPIKDAIFDETPTTDCIYQSESPKKYSKCRKPGRKNKRESRVSGKEKRSKFTSVFSTQTKVLGVRKYFASFIKADIKGYTYENISSLVNGTKNSKELNLLVGIDFSDTTIPRDLKINTDSTFGYLSWYSALYEINLRIQLPISYEFVVNYNVSYNIKENSLEMLLQGVASKYLLPIVNSDVKSKTIIDKKDKHLKKYNNFGTFFDKAQTILNIVHFKDSKDSNTFKIFCPTFFIIQSTENIQIKINVGDGIQHDSIEIIQSSSCLVELQFTNQGSCSVPLKYCLRVSSCSSDDKRCLIDCKQQFKFAAVKSQTQATLGTQPMQALTATGTQLMQAQTATGTQPMHAQTATETQFSQAQISSGQLYVLLQKESSVQWSAVWVGLHHLSELPLQQSAEVCLID